MHCFIIVITNSYECMINTLWRVGLLKVKRAPEPAPRGTQATRGEPPPSRARHPPSPRLGAALVLPRLRSLAPRLHKSTLSHSSDPSFARLSSHVNQ